MPKIVTKNYSDAVFLSPTWRISQKGYGLALSRGHSSVRLIGRLRLKQGADTELTEGLASLRVLENSLVDWKGFFDANEKPIEYSRETLREVWENDPAIFTNIYWRIREIARMGELDDQKN